MFMICWSTKGGSGTTTVSCTLALVTARRGVETVLVDLAGDALAALGITTPVKAGVAEWFASDAPTQALNSLRVECVDGLSVLPARDQVADAIGGEHPRFGEFVRWLTDSEAHVVIDAGTNVELVRSLMSSIGPSSRSVLVVRNCFLALQRAQAAPNPTDVVLVRELNRALQFNDVEAALGVRIRADLLCDPSIAKAVDAGLANTRLPRLLWRPLRPLAETLG